MGISAGSADESGPVVDFLVSNDNTTLNGTLTYTPAANANKTATVTVRLHDNSGTANGGVDASANQTITITITPDNDPVSTTSVAVALDPPGHVYAKGTQVTVTTTFSDIDTSGPHGTHTRQITWDDLAGSTQAR
jgi:hypothetical protein